MDVRLGEIVKLFNASLDSPITGIGYTYVYGQKQKISVIPQQLDGFLDQICELCSDDEHGEEDDSEKKYHHFGHPLAEIISKRTTPIMIKFRFPFNVHATILNNTTVYNDTLLFKISLCLQEVLLDKLNISEVQNELIHVIEESKAWYCPDQDTTYIDMRFTFPYCQVDVNYQKIKLYKDIIERLRQEKLLNDFSIQPVKEWTDIILPLSNISLFYRGKDSHYAAPMKMTHIIGAIEELATVDDLQLTINIFNPNNYHHMFSGVTSGDFLSKNTKLHHWLPLFLSIHFWAGETSIREVHTSNDEYEIEYDETVSSDNPKIMINNLLPMLSISRFEIEPYWKEIGQILYNIYGNDEIGMQLFIQYSLKVNNKTRSYEVCTNYYRKLSFNHLTIKTIAWYARIDNPKMYQKWHNLWVKPALMESFTKNHDKVAEVVYRILWDRHIWAGGSRWFFFRNHRLEEQQDAIDLRRDITKIVVPIYEKLRAEYVNTTSLSINKKEIEGYIKQIGETIDRLGNGGFKSSIVRALQENFEVKNFDRIKDSDPAKTGWSNCVVVCSGDHAYTVDGKPEDYITKSTHIPYRHDLHWDHPLVCRFMTWMGQMFVDRELRHYVLKDLGSFLYGRNAEKLLRFWCGEGDNSKSMFAKAIQMCHGLYCVDFPPTFLTGKSIGSSGPNPELAQAHGAHLGFVPETEDDEKIREGTAKRATGGDRQFARMCNENGGPMEMMAKVILLCNKIPEFTSVSTALRNRFVYVPFLSTWTDNAPESVEEQYKEKRFKKDPFFEAQLPELAQALGWVSVQYYHYYKVEGLKQPPIVIEYTSRHWEENDPILCFLTEKVIRVYEDPVTKVLDRNKSMTASDLYPIFKTWFSQNYPGTQVPNQAGFKINVLPRLGPQTNRRWYGIALRSTENNIQTSDVPTASLISI